MSDNETPQLSPEEFGRRVADAFIPIVEESFRRIMDEWSEQLRSAQEKPAAQAVPEWKGGGDPTPAQLKQMTENANGSVMDRILSSVDEIKAAVNNIASNGSA